MPPGQSPNAMLLERLDALRGDMADLKAAQMRHMEEDRRTREAYLVESTQAKQQLDAAHRRLDGVDTAVSDLQRAIIELQKAMIANAGNLERMNQRLGIVVAVVSFIGFSAGGWLLARLLGLIA